MTIEITDAAVNAVREAREAENLPAETPLRVAVKAGGCSGFAYSLSFDTEPAAEDHVIERDGVRFLLDRQSGALLSGATLDYTTGLGGRGFVFTNPSASGTCGCGESFSV
jgi:iron-sulfur cluster assembly accessory protein